MFENKLTLTNFKPTKFGLKVRGGRGGGGGGGGSGGCCTIRFSARYTELCDG